MNDNHEEKWTITSIYESKNHYEVSQEGLTCYLAKHYGVTPKVGDQLTIYTTEGRFGSIRGMDLNSERIYFKSDEELEQQ